MIRSMQHVAAPRHMRGIGLIEVMVSVLVLAVGLLGIAAMQSLALRGGQSSLESSQAVMQTASIIEAMRANPAGSYNGTYNAPPAVSNVATRDLNYWMAGMRGVANADVVTTTPAIVDAGATAIIAGCPAACVVTVQWNDTRAGGSATRQISVRAQI